MNLDDLETESKLIVEFNAKFLDILEHPYPPIEERLQKKQIGEYKEHVDILLDVLTVYRLIGLSLVCYPPQELSKLTMGWLTIIKYDADKVYASLKGCMLPNHVLRALSIIYTNDLSFNQQITTAFIKDDKQTFTSLLNKTNIKSFSKLNYICNIYNNFGPDVILPMCEKMGGIAKEEKLVAEALDVKYNSEAPSDCHINLFGLLHKVAHISDYFDSKDEVKEYLLAELTSNKEVLHKLYVAVFSFYLLQFWHDLTSTQQSMLDNFANKSEIALWSSEAINEAKKIYLEMNDRFNIDEESTSVSKGSPLQQHDEIFELPENIFRRDGMAPTGSYMRAYMNLDKLKNKGVSVFRDFINELADKGYIDNNIECKKAFARNILGCNLDSSVDKVLWYGTKRDLYYLIHVIGAGHKLYQDIPSYFDFQQEESGCYKNALGSTLASRPTPDFKKLINYYYN